MTGFPPAEILVSDLSSLVLELAVWGVRDPATLFWLDAPPEAALAAGRELLRGLGAMDREGRATETGQRMAELLSIRELPGCCPGTRAGVVGPASSFGPAERDIFHYRPGDTASLCESDLLERYEAVADRRQRGDERVQAAAVRAVERSAAQLLRLMGAGGGFMKRPCGRMMPPGSCLPPILIELPGSGRRAVTAICLPTAVVSACPGKAGSGIVPFCWRFRWMPEEKRRDSSIRPAP
jgi:ATP-dependent helicase HrpB